MVGGIPSDSIIRADSADLVAVVLPPPAGNQTVGKLLPIAKEEAIVLNMATTAHGDPELAEKNKAVSIVDAKIIGHSGTISRGEPGIVVIVCSDEDRFNRIKGQLPGFNEVVRGEANLVEKINKAGSTEGIREQEERIFFQAGEAAKPKSRLANLVPAVNFPQKPVCVIQQMLSHPRKNQIEPHNLHMIQLQHRSVGL